jgi:hypothetical protein
LDDTGAQLEGSPKKSLRLLALQSGNVKNLSLHSNKTMKIMAIQSYSHTRTLSCRLGSKKPVLQVVSRISSQHIS